mgnify:FL=1
MDEASPTKWLDRQIIKKFGLSPQNEFDYSAARDEKYVSNIDHILKDMDIIDSKSSALLAHVSIMIAVAFGLTAIDNLNYVVKGLLYVEAFAYILVALFLMRCLEIVGPPLRKMESSDRQMFDKYNYEILVRRAVYQTSVRAVIWLTVGLGAVLTIEVIIWAVCKIHV